MSEMVKCLLCKHENLSLDPKNPQKTSHGSMHLEFQHRKPREKQISETWLLASLVEPLAPGSVRDDLLK